MNILGVISQLIGIKTLRLTVISKNIWVSDKGEPENWIKNIQGEINLLRMKGININVVFSLLVKMMKKLELYTSPTGMDSN